MDERSRSSSDVDGEEDDGDDEEDDDEGDSDTMMITSKIRHSV